MVNFDCLETSVVIDICTMKLSDMEFFICWQNFF
jgi:hypothetical protein